MGSTSRFGAFLDSTLDRWAEVALYSALVWLFLSQGQDTGVMLATAAMATSLLVSYTRARAEGVGIPCKEGLLTRFERMLLLIAGLIFNQIILALGVIAILAGITAVQRIWTTWRQSRVST
jgi:CDP-diacylglycerol--glycerol-3-phosphate 3-phosphatidyltransferase